MVALLFVLVALGGLVVASALRCRRTVRVQQVLVLRNRRLGHVTSIIIGPKTVFVPPLLVDALFLDLTMKRSHLVLQDVGTADLPILVELELLYALDPTLLHIADLDLVLPSLDCVDTIVEGWVEYVLRSLAAGSDSEQLLNAPVIRARLERLLLNTVQSRVDHVGVRLHLTRILLRPHPKVQEAQLTAKVRTQQLEMLVNALGPNHPQLQHLLSFELLRLHQNNLHIVAALDLPSLPLPAAPSQGEPRSPSLPWVTRVPDLN